MRFERWVEDIGGMSDLCMYELEDIVWDQFGESDDHIVPHPGDEHEDKYAVQGDSCKKPRCEVVGVTSNSDHRNAAKYVIQGKEETGFSTVKNKKDTMLEKGSWSHAPDGALPASCDGDSIKEGTSLASDGTRMSSHCFKRSNIELVASEFCADDPIIGDRCAAVDNNLYRYPLSHISQTENDLSFLDNDCEDKESSDLLYYGWPDIGNFEEVDRMFRSCDSTFGLESVSHEDELGWFSSSHAIEGSEDALQSGFKFSCSGLSALKSISEHHEASRLNNASPSIHSSNKKSISTSYKTSSPTLDADDPAALGRSSFGNGLDKTSEIKDEYVPEEQINLHKKQSKHQRQSEGKRKGHYLENGGSFNRRGELKQSADIKLPFGDSSRQVFSSPCIRQQKQNVGSHSLTYLQTHTSYMHSDYSHPSDQIAVRPTLSSIKSENNGYPSLSPKESSYASNQVQSMESSHDPSFETVAITMDPKKEKLYCRQGLQTSFTGNPKHVNLVVQAAFCDPVSVQKQVHHSGNEVENLSEVKGVSIVVPVELDSSNVQESSCMSSVLDEISLEATSFRQLQHVMEQLDIRTKLCIRDSLYRLAWSAEQRHNCGNLNGGSRANRDAGGALVAEETNKCTGFIDMETDTNPIDRSIAHLLFHRPSDPSVTPAQDALSLKSHAMIHGSITSPPVVAEKLVCQEETAAGADKKLLMTDDI